MKRLIRSNMVYTWDEIIKIHQDANVRAYSLPYGDYKNCTFELKTILLNQIPKKFYGKKKEYQKYGDDESVYLIDKLIKSYKNNENIPPVILDENYNVIDGSHRLSAQYELKISEIKAFVLKDYNNENIEKYSAKQVGIIYHFTKAKNLLDILENNTLKGYIDKYGYAISFTRDKELWYNNSSVRILFNGDSLSNTYKIEPFNFFQEKSAAYNASNSNESEERIWLDKIDNVISYILSIDISRSKLGGFREYMLQEKLGELYSIEDIAKYVTEKFGIPVNIIN